MNTILRHILSSGHKIFAQKRAPLLSRCFCNPKSSDETINQPPEDISDRNLKTMVEDAVSFEEKDLPEDEWTTPVYPKLTKRMQSRHSFRPQRDPSSTCVILFPGQGVQYVGMAKSLLKYENVPEMFKIASEILGYDLLDLCLHGPKQMLDDTNRCQAAIMVASLAAVEKLKAENPDVLQNCVAAAGFSVGEYTALVFSGAMTFEDGVNLLKIRGDAMQAASELCPSGMMTVTLSADAKIKHACNAAREYCTTLGMEKPECCLAIYLLPQCRVIAGHKEALQFLEKNATDLGIKRIKYLPVSGAFHSRLMKPAQEILAKALEKTPLEKPLIPVHANVDGKIYTDEDQIRKKLTQQLCEPVKWEQTMHIIYERPQGTAFPFTYECGPQRSLKTILKRNNLKAFTNCENIYA